MSNILLVTRYFSFLLIIAVAFSACKKDEAETPIIIEDPDPIPSATSDHVYLSGQLIEANFRGLIRDENGQSLSGVAISIGSAQTNTDADGMWQILDVMVDSERAYIKAKKQGYFHGSRVLTPTDVGFNRAFITLMTAQTTGTVSSASGGEISHSSGSMLSLPADGYIDEDGNTYSGMVDVQMVYLDPSTTEILDQMPGNLTAIESDNDFVTLKTYGMIGVELIGSGGQTLQLAPDASAEIHVVVPPEGLASAPSSIALWHFDEEEGVWRQDGNATLTGNMYIGSVSHFSFWNCDVPTDYIFLEGYALGEEAAYPVQGVQIVLISEGLGNGNAYTDQEGYFGGFIPGNEVLTMEVYSPCGDLLNSQEIGPFDTDTTIPVIAIFEEVFGIITGTLVDCGDEPGEGFITVINEGYLPESVEVAEDGSFVMTYGCPPQDVELIGFSSDYFTNSGAISVTTIPGETVEIGDVDLCAVSTEEFIVFTALGDTYYLDGQVTSSSTSATPLFEIFGSQFINGVYYEILFTMEDSPTPPTSSFIGWGNNFFIGTTVYGGLAVVADMDWSYTSYSSNSGDYLEFTFTATYDIDIDGNQIPGGEVVSGSGRVQRE